MLAPPSARDLVALFSELDGPWKTRIEELLLGWRYDWPLTPPNERTEIASFFGGHPYPEARIAVCRALAEWDDVDHLVALAHDRDPSVRQAAIYHLAGASQSREVAALTWERIASGELAGTGGGEALRTYAAHAPEAESRERLLGLAQGDLRESVRSEAIALLGDSDVAAMLALLTEPPLVTWSVHGELLARCTSTGLEPPPIAHLREVDNLRLVEELAAFDASRHA